MTVAQAAERIGVSSSKVYQLVASRVISHYRVGGKVVFTDADIDVYLASCRVEAVTQIVTAPHARLKLKHLSLRR